MDTQTDTKTDRQAESSILPKTSFYAGIKIKSSGVINQDVLFVPK